MVVRYRLYSTINPLQHHCPDPAYWIQIMKKIIIVFLLITAVVAPLLADPVTEVSLSGKITDQKNQPLIGVSIYFPELKTGAVTDLNGFYQLNHIPARKLLLQVSSMGYKTIVETCDFSQVHELSFKMEESIIEINEIAVTGQSEATQLNRMPAPVEVLTAREMNREVSTNLIDALSHQPGVSEITTGSGISKPVIRGLGYNRVVVVDDGVRQEGQQWGDEHGIEIDENSVGRAEILKGPASLMYGSDAMAGVINFLPPPVLPEGKMAINALMEYQTNNGLINYSLDFAGHKKIWEWDVRYSNKMAHAYHNAYDGYVFNSGFSENALTGMMGISPSWGYSNLTLSWYHLTPGIVEGNRNSQGQFTKQVSLNDTTVANVPATMSDFMSYKPAVPLQQVNHLKAVWNNNIFVGDGSLKTTLGFQQNQRQEFANPLQPDIYGLYFLLNTLNYSAAYTFPEVRGFSFSTGLNGMWQQSLNLGTEFLVPAYRLFDAGIYLTAKKTIGSLDISGGLRFDNRTETSDQLFVDANGAKTVASTQGAIERFPAFHDDFSGVSGSLGASLQLDKGWTAKLNVSRGYRAPNIAELASNGVHEGTIRYEIGNPALKSENSWQLDGELDYNTHHVNAKLNLFVNNINNFIYSHKLLSVNGGDSIRDNVSCFKFDAGNARLVGGEFYIDMHPHPWDWLHFENTFSYVHSVLLNQPDSTRYLPFTPAAKWMSDLKADIKMPVRWLKNTYGSVGMEYDFEQNNVYRAFGTETPTPAYALLNAGIGTDVVNKKHQTLFSVFINGSNLTDTAYQSHLSRLKYAPVNDVTGRTGVFNMGRNVSLKIIVPVDL